MESEDELQESTNLFERRQRSWLRLFTFVKEDKDEDENPKETEVIEFLSKLRADSNTTA